MKNALVIGGARSGSGAALLLKHLGYHVVLVARDDFDKRKELEDGGIEVILDDADTDRFDHFDLVVKNPGIPNDHPLVKRFKTVLNEIDLAFRFHSQGLYYAISGTNGKTTTTSILYEMLKRKNESAVLAGNIGVSLSEVVLETKDIPIDVAIEISAFQMEGTPNFKPKVYGLLNLTPDHLDRYQDENDYYQAKLKIVDQADIFIRNIDDKNIVKLTNKNKNTLDLSLTKKADIYIIDQKVYFKTVMLFETQTMKLVGAHNLLNMMFASTMAYLAGVSLIDIQAVVSSFKGVEHRLEYVDTLDGRVFYNDSKATNPESTEKALQSFDKPVILLAGGYDKKIKFDLLSQFNPKAVILFGESKYLLKQVFKEAYIVDAMQDALDKAMTISEVGDVILLSPACASYDQFENFEARGIAFKNMVNKLKER